jgi:hypothetical protein
MLSTTSAEPVVGTSYNIDMEALGPVLLALSIPFMLRWIPRNYAFGFRIVATLANDSVWYDANARFGRHTFLLGLFMVALEFVLPIAIRNQVLATVAMVGLPILTVVNWRTANRWRRERETVLQP